MPEFDEREREQMEAIMRRWRNWVRQVPVGILSSLMGRSFASAAEAERLASSQEAPQPQEPAPADAKKPG